MAARRLALLAFLAAVAIAPLALGDFRVTLLCYIGLNALVALGLSAGCGSKDTGDTTAVAEYAAPMEDCSNDTDDDGDNLTDCDDPDCTDSPECTMDAYAAPFE